MAKAKNIPLNPIAGLSYGSSQNFEKNENTENKNIGNVVDEKENLSQTDSEILMKVMEKTQEKKTKETQSERFNLTIPKSVSKKLKVLVDEGVIISKSNLTNILLADFISEYESKNGEIKFQLNKTV